MTIDIIIFYGDLLLLELRLNQHSFVDQFVIIENGLDFQGLEKETQFAANKDRFKQFNILHDVLAYWPPEADNPHKKADFWRNYAFNRFKFKPKDTIIFTDLDEIIRAEKFKEYKGELTAVEFEFYMYWYNVHRGKWINGFIAPYEFCKDKDMTELRYNYNRGYKYKTRLLKDAGWHFSWTGGVKILQDKYRNFRGVEQWPEEFQSAEWVEKLINERREFTNDRIMPIVPVDASFPEWMRNNLDKFKGQIA